MKWTLNTYQVGQNWSLDQLIEMCVKTGYPYIEVLQDFQQPHGLEWDTPEEKYVEAKAKFDAAGVRFGSLTSCQTFHAAEQSERAESVKRVKHVIDMAKLVGCDHVRVLGDQLPKDEGARVPVVDNIAECIEELGDYAGPDIAVSIEVHGSFTDPYYAMMVVEKVGLPNVGLVFNSQWPVGKPWRYSLPVGTPSIRPFFEMVYPYLTSVHLHAMENPDTLRYYQEFFALLVENGYSGYVANEAAYTGPDPEKVLRMYTAMFQVMASA